MALKKVLTSHSLCLELLDIKKETFIVKRSKAVMSTFSDTLEAAFNTRDRISTILSFITVYLLFNGCRHFVKGALHEVTWCMVVWCTQNAPRRQQFHVAPAMSAL